VLHYRCHTAPYGSPKAGQKEVGSDFLARKVGGSPEIRIFEKGLETMCQT
jgi:hypothetical protein